MHLGLIVLLDSPNFGLGSLFNFAQTHQPHTLDTDILDLGTNESRSHHQVRFNTTPGSHFAPALFVIPTTIANEAFD